jgi:tetratricopeptide (TPR) repeat protein
MFYKYLLLSVAIGTITAPNLSDQKCYSVSLVRKTRLNQARNQIYGHVFDSAHHPIPFIYIELMNDYYQMIARTRTDGSGQYSFKNLSSGNFKVKVIASGTDYEEQVQDVTIINFGRQTASGPVMSGGEARELDFVLRPRKSASSTSVTANAPGVIFVQQVPEAAQRIYDQAVRNLDGGKRTEQGIAELKSALEIYPDYYLALERLGTEYVRQEKYEMANPVLTKAIDVNPRGYQSLYSLGVAKYHLKEKPAALELLTRALAVSPNSVNAHLWLGIILRQSGRFAEAETHLKRADALGNNKVAEAHWQLALLYNQLKRYRDAADQLELFLKAQPDSRDTEKIKELIKQLREKAS